MWRSLVVWRLLTYVVRTCPQTTHHLTVGAVMWPVWSAMYSLFCETLWDWYEMDKIDQQPLYSCLRLCEQLWDGHSCVCMYAWIHIRIRVCMYVCMYTHILCVYVYTHIIWDRPDRKASWKVYERRYSLAILKYRVSFCQSMSAASKACQQLPCRKVSEWLQRFILSSWHTLVAEGRIH